MQLIVRMFQFSHLAEIMQSCIEIEKDIFRLTYKPSAPLHFASLTSLQDGQVLYTIPLFLEIAESVHDSS